MSCQREIPVIIFSGKEILIQDIQLEYVPELKPKLRKPTRTELEKIAKACENTMDALEWRWPICRSKIYS
jgi:hypothetical protein